MVWSSPISLLALPAESPKLSFRQSMRMRHGIIGLVAVFPAAAAAAGPPSILPTSTSVLDPASLPPFHRAVAMRDEVRQAS